MRKRLVLLSCGAVALLMTPAVAAPWMRSYVVTNYEPAWYYGGGKSFRKAGVLEPGSDCPKGSFGDIDYDKVLLTPWRDAKAVYMLNHPEHTDPAVIPWIHIWALSYRGFREGIDSYINPFSAPDPGMQQVTGKIAEGFDLDHNAKTGGFTSPDGQRGIDNAYYRAWGCLPAFRDVPYRAVMSTRANDKMVEGLYTFVIRISGNKDPMNDDDATVEIGFSPDHMIRGATGGILSDYSFRIVKNNEGYSKVKATVKAGVVETEQIADLHAPRLSWFPNVVGDADFHQGRFRLVTDASGNVSGLIGGYRDWRDLYVEDHFTQKGGTEERRDHQNSMGMYYALKRNADGLPDPKTGKNMGISIAYRFRAAPAFVVDPLSPPPPITATSPSIEYKIRSFHELRAAFFKAIATRQIQPIPDDADEALNPRAFDHIVRLPNGGWAYVHDPFPGEQSQNPEERSPTDKAEQRQVQNGAPAVVASVAVQ